MVFVVKYVLDLGLTERETPTVCRLVGCADALLEVAMLEGGVVPLTMNG